MYKKIFMGIAAVAALTLVSCSSDDLNSLSDNSSKNEAISFDGYLGRSAVAVNGSRGSVLEIADLKKLKDGFGVFGNYNATGGQNFGSNLFDNQPVAYKTSAWTYSPLRYWPTEGHIDFLAYAPYDVNTALNTTLEGNMTSCINFTVENTVAKQKDLLWANAENKTKDNIFGTENKVKFQFAHALSRLGYSIKLKDAYSDATITLKKITLAGSADEATKAFYKEGTIDLSKEDKAAKLWTPSTTADKQNFTWFSGDQKLTDKVANNTEYLFVIPQDFSQKTSGADELYVIVEYTIQTGTTALMTSKVYQKIDKNFEQGKAYMINLTIGLTPIDFNADVTVWDESDKGYDIPLN